MRRKEPLKGNLPQKEPAADRQQLRGPHPVDAVLARYVDESLDVESAEHVRVHLVDCAECYQEVRVREEIGAVGDLDAPEPVEAVEFLLRGLPTSRERAGPEAWWTDPKISTSGPWLQQGRYRLAIARQSRKALSLCLRHGRRPIVHALAVLEPVSTGAVARLAWGVTNEQGEATFKLREPTPPANREYRVRVLVVSDQV